MAAVGIAAVAVAVDHASTTTVEFPSRLNIARFLCFKDEKTFAMDCPKYISEETTVTTSPEISSISTKPVPGPTTWQNLLSSLKRSRRDLEKHR